MKLDDRPKILQIVELIQAIAVVFVSLSAVGWAAFYAEKCGSGLFYQIASYLALGAASLLFILAVILGFKIADLLGQGCKPLAGAFIHVIMTVFVVSSYVVVGHFALDNWSSRLKNCPGAVAPQSIGAEGVARGGDGTSPD
jgi:hypothetical protein